MLMLHGAFFPVTFLDEIPATMGTSATVRKGLPGHAYLFVLPIFSQ